MFLRSLNLENWTQDWKHSVKKVASKLMAAVGDEGEERKRGRKIVGDEGGKRKKVSNTGH